MWNFGTWTFKYDINKHSREVACAGNELEDLTLCKQYKDGEIAA